MFTEKPTASERLLDRRQVLGASVGIAAAGLVVHLDSQAQSAAQDATPAEAGGDKATFVLVHGGWAGSWIWNKVIPLLRLAGHDVYATTGTGLGDRVHLADPGIDLDLHITDVVNVLEFEELSNVTLVGHSSGGSVITGVAERVPERLAQLVYLDAAVPSDGESDYDAELYSEEAVAADIAAGEAAGMPGFVPVSPPVEEWLRAMVPDPADQEWLMAKLMPHPFAAWAQPVQLGDPAAAALPRAFILCTEGKGDAAVDHTVRTLNRVRSDPGWRVVDVVGNHMAPVNAPQLTADALLSLV